MRNLVVLTARVEPRKRAPAPSVGERSPIPLTPQSFAPQSRGGSTGSSRRRPQPLLPQSPERFDASSVHSGRFFTVPLLPPPARKRFVVRGR
jgi:hypothetical protein